MKGSKITLTVLETCFAMLVTRLAATLAAYTGCYISMPNCLLLERL